MWSHNTNSIAFLIRFHVRFKIPMCSYTLAKKMSERFSVISNLAVSTRIAVDYCRLDFFFWGNLLNLNKLPSLQVNLKIILSLQNGIVSSTVRLKHALKSSEDSPVYGNTHTNCSLGTVKPTLFLTNNLSKKHLMHESMKFLGSHYFRRLTSED